MTPWPTEKGQIIYIDNNHKGKFFDTALIAAPVYLDSMPYYMGVVIKQSGPQDNSYYMHDAVVVQKMKNATDSVKQVADVPKGATREESESSSIASILASLANYNREFKETLEKGSIEKWRALNHTAMLSSSHSYVWSAPPNASISESTENSNAQKNFSREAQQQGNGQAQKENEQARYSTKAQDQLTEDKYFQRAIDAWDGTSSGGRVKIGVINKGGIYEGVGLPDGVLYMDYSKLAKALSKHGDHLSKSILKQIPQMLASPVVITQPINPQVKNTVNVFGDLMGDNGKPIMVSIMMRPDRTGTFLIDVIRTVEMRSDVQKLITDQSVLYLSENKKRTADWFQGLGNSSVPFAGTKSGFIRSIAYESENSNSQGGNSLNGVDTQKTGASYSLRNVDTDMTETQREEKKTESASSSSVENNDAQTETPYAYRVLTEKGDRTVVDVSDVGEITRDEAVQRGLENVRKYTDKTDRNGVPMMYVDDLGKYVTVGSKALHHGLDRRVKVNGAATAHIGDLLKQAVVINEADPKKENHTNTYVLLSVARDSNQENVYVRMVVNQSTGQLEDVTSLYALNTKKGARRVVAPNGEVSPGVPAGSTMTIAEILENVKDIYSDVLSKEDVEQAKNIFIINRK